MKRYQRKVHELEQDKQILQKENEELKSQVACVLTSSDGGGKKVKEYYMNKLTGLEAQVSELKRKLEMQSQLSCQKPKRDDGTKLLQDEIVSLKAQKAEMQRKMKEESVQFRLEKALLEKEVLQLKKEVRIKTYKTDMLIAFSLRLKMVLQRKIEEAFAATKRLSGLFDSRKTSENDKGNLAAGDVKGQKDQDQAKKEKNEVKLQMRGICSKYERQLQEISSIENGEHEMKKYTDMLDQTEIGSILEDIDTECQKKDVEIRHLIQDIKINSRGKETELRDLKEQVAKLSGWIRQLDLQKKEPKKLQNSTIKSSTVQKSSNLKNATDSGISDNSNCFGRDSNLSDVTNTSGQSQSVSEAAKTSTTVTCCSCGRGSKCQTKNCKCRAAGGSCGASCGCAPSKCKNREAVFSVKVDSTPESEEMDLSKGSSEGADTAEKNSTLAAHGAVLLESAFVAAEKINQNGGSRIPLSDIGNKQDAANAKPAAKKKNRKSKESEVNPTDGVIIPTTRALRPRQNQA